MFSRYGVQSLVKLNEARAAASRRASGTGGAPGSFAEIGMFVRLGIVIAVVGFVVAYAGIRH